MVVKEAERGIVYIAYGSGARREVQLSIQSLREHCDLSVTVIADRTVNGVKTSIVDSPTGLPGRWAKTRLYWLTPYEHTLFLDADTRPFSGIDVGFRLLQWFDLIGVASRYEPLRMFDHLNRDEKCYTEYILVDSPMQVNTGVLWFKKNKRLENFWAAWRKEWFVFRDRDQGAFLRALVNHPIRLFLLGRAFNGGRFIQHRFGGCRRP